MSLIFGLCLPRKIYLVSDSRLTSGDGSYKDDFAKWVDLNPRLAVVVANSAHQAAWLLRKIIKDIRPTVGWEWDFAQLEEYLHSKLQDYATEYYTETGNYGHSVNMIFGGFEGSKKLKLETARLGEIMAAPLLAAGEGVSVFQTLDRDIVEAMRGVFDKAAQRGLGEVSAGTLFEVDLPCPRVLAVSIRATSHGAEVAFEDADCYSGIVFNPNFRTEKVELPVDLIGNLEYRDKSSEKGVDGLYRDNAYIILYVEQLIKERGWPTVGGNIQPLLVMANSSGFAAGRYDRRDATGVITHGGINEIDGKPHYYDQVGELLPYRFIYDYLSEAGMDAGAKL